MKSISITIIVVIMMLFGGPLLSIKDNLPRIPQDIKILLNKYIGKILGIT